MCKLTAADGYTDPVALPDRINLSLGFDPQPLLAEIEELSAQAWTPHFVPQHYSGEWSVLPLRAPRGAEHPILRITSSPGCSDWVDTEYLEHCPSIGSALERFKCPLAAVRLMYLGSNSEIFEHRDADLDAKLGMARIHIPLSSNPNVTFLLNRSAVEMEPGDCWYLRLSDPHSVSNEGNCARIHLVIDAEVNDWLSNLLATASHD